MNGVRVAAHHSNRRSDSRKLFSMTASPSVAVVEEMAPMCTTASSLRPSSQRNRSAGGTKLAIGEIAPLAVAAENVVDGNVGAAGLVEARHDVRSDEPGPAGDQ